MWASRNFACTLVSSETRLRYKFIGDVWLESRRLNHRPERGSPTAVFCAASARAAAVFCAAAVNAGWRWRRLRRRRRRQRQRRRWFDDSGWLEAGWENRRGGGGTCLVGPSPKPVSHHHTSTGMSRKGGLHCPTPGPETPTDHWKEASPDVPEEVVAPSGLESSVTPTRILLTASGSRVLAPPGKDQTPPPPPPPLPQSTSPPPLAAAVAADTAATTNDTATADAASTTAFCATSYFVNNRIYLISVCWTPRGPLERVAA